MALSTDNKDFTRRVNQFGKVQAATSQEMHELACMAIYHSIKDGQITPANTLISKIGKGSRKNDLISWIQSWGNLTFDSKEKVFKHKVRHNQDESNATLVMNKAFDEPFWTVIEEPKVVKDVDIKLDISLWLKGEKKKAEKVKLAGGKVTNQEFVTKLEALLA